MSHGQPRDPRKEQFWRRHVQRWQASGLTIRDYCQQHHLSEPSFYGWRRELAARDQASPPTPPVTFVPVHVQAAPATPPAPLELLLADGRCLRIPPGCDRDTLRTILTLLREAAC